MGSLLLPKAFAQPFPQSSDQTAAWRLLSMHFVLTLKKTVPWPIHVLLHGNRMRPGRKAERVQAPLDFEMFVIGMVNFVFVN